MVLSASKGLAVKGCEVLRNWFYDAKKLLLQSFYDANISVIVMVPKKCKGIRVSMEKFGDIKDISIVPLYAAGYFLTKSDR